MLRVVAEPGMLADVGQAQRPAFVEQRSQNAVNAGQSADLIGPSLGYPQGHEAREAAFAIRNPERRVASTGCGSSRAEDPLEHAVEVQVAGYRQQVQVAVHRAAILSGAVEAAHPASGRLGIGRWSESR